MRYILTILTMVASCFIIVMMAGCQPPATAPGASSNATAPDDRVAPSAAARGRESDRVDNAEPAESVDMATTPQLATSSTVVVDPPPVIGTAGAATDPTTTLEQPSIQAAPAVELPEDGSMPSASADAADGPSARAGQSKPQMTEAGAPLLLDDSPLLLDDDESDSDQPVADNSRCMHCHLNFADEELAATHAHANIGCAKCHGNCDAHIADESWASGGNGTPPETMYPRNKIVPACLECHPRDKIDIDEHQAWLTGKEKDKICTDCHGEHRIPGPRKCKWK